MKKLAIAALLLAAGCSGTTVGPNVTSKYWQDAILKPNQSWEEAYGTSDDSKLAHGVAQLTRAVQAQAGAIGILKGELDAMKSINGAIDPNEVTE